MCAAWLKEYSVLKRFALYNKIPTRNLLITTGIFSLSYVVRTLLNLLSLIDPTKLRNLQMNSCLNGSIGWALVVFFTHFLGEILPLFLLFWMQLTMYAKKIEEEIPQTDLFEDKPNQIPSFIEGHRQTLLQIEAAQGHS